MKIKISIIILIILLFSIVTPFKNIYASSIGEIITGADKFLEDGNEVSTVMDEGQLKNTSDFIYKVLLTIGIVVMFIVGTIIGIQFMVASAEDKAKVKEALVPYVIGCAIIFGAFAIWKIAVGIGQSII